MQPPQPQPQVTAGQAHTIAQPPPPPVTVPLPLPLPLPSPCGASPVPSPPPVPAVAPPVAFPSLSSGSDSAGSGSDGGGSSDDGGTAVAGGAHAQLQPRPPQAHRKKARTKNLLEPVQKKRQAAQEAAAAAAAAAAKAAQVAQTAQSAAAASSSHAAATSTAAASSASLASSALPASSRTPPTRQPPTASAVPAARQQIAAEVTRNAQPSLPSLAQQRRMQAEQQQAESSSFADGSPPEFISAAPPPRPNQRQPPRQSQHPSQLQSHQPPLSARQPPPPAASHSRHRSEPAFTSRRAGHDADDEDDFDLTSLSRAPPTRNALHSRSAAPPQQQRHRNVQRTAAAGLSMEDDDQRGSRELLLQSSQQPMSVSQVAASSVQHFAAAAALSHRPMQQITQQQSNRSLQPLAAAPPAASSHASFAGPFSVAAGPFFQSSSSAPTAASSVSAQQRSNPWVQQHQQQQTRQPPQLQPMKHGPFSQPRVMPQQQSHPQPSAWTAQPAQTPPSVPPSYPRSFAAGPSYATPRTQLPPLEPASEPAPFAYEQTQAHRAAAPPQSMSYPQPQSGYAMQPMQPMQQQQQQQQLQHPVVAAPPMHSSGWPPQPQPQSTLQASATAQSYGPPASSYSQSLHQQQTDQWMQQRAYSWQPPAPQQQQQQPPMATQRGAMSQQLFDQPAQPSMRDSFMPSSHLHAQQQRFGFDPNADSPPSSWSRSAARSAPSAVPVKREPSFRSHRQARNDDAEAAEDASSPAAAPPRSPPLHPLDAKWRGHRRDAKLSGDGTLDAYFRKKPVAQSSDDDENSTPNRKSKKRKTDAAGSSGKKKADKQSRSEAAYMSARRLLMGEEAESMTEEEAMAAVAASSARAAPAAASSSAPMSDGEYEFEGRRVSLSEFRQQFDEPTSKPGFAPRAFRLLNSMGALDLDQPDVLDVFLQCVSQCDQYQMSVLHANLSSNFRAETKEQRKWIKQQFGGKKRGRRSGAAAAAAAGAGADEEGDEADLRGLPGGVEPSIAMIYQFTRRKAPGAAADAEEGQGHDPISPSAFPLDPIGGLAPADDSAVWPVHCISPFGSYSPHGMSHVRTFFLRMDKPRALDVRSGQTEKERDAVTHAWRLRSTLLSLLKEPPPHLHCMVFDAKSVVCALLVHLRVPALDCDLLPQLTDSKLAAWMMDPDDAFACKLECPKIFAKLFPDAAVPQGTPGDGDVRLLMDDMARLPRLEIALGRNLQKEELIRPLVHQEHCVLPVAIDMQIRGVAVDFKKFEEARVQLTQKIAEQHSAATSVVGYELNLASSDQVANVIYTKFNAPKPTLQDKGRSQAQQKKHLTTNSAALKGFVQDTSLNPKLRKFAEIVLKFRSLNKALTGYLDPYEKAWVSSDSLLLSPAGGRLPSAFSYRRLCPSWNQCSTGTGRFSCSAPNLQAIPRGATKQLPSVDSAAAASSSSSSSAPAAAATDPIVLDGDDGAGDDSDETTMDESTPAGAVAPKGAHERACHVVLPIHVNVRDAIVPTPAPSVAAQFAALFAQLDQQSMQIVTVEPPPEVQGQEATHSGFVSVSAIPAAAPAAAAPAAVSVPRLLSAALQEHASRSEPRILMAADYSQMEVRLVALLSADPNFIALFQSPDADLYRQMAARMFYAGDDAKVTPDDRTIAKTIVLGVLYGMGSDSLSLRLSKFLNRRVSSRDAQSHISRLFEGFPALKLFMSDTKAGGALSGFVPTLAHRKRFLPDLGRVQCSAVRKAYAERQAVNTVIQGSAADMTKMAMIGLSRHIRSTPSLHGRVWLVMQLHDEIVIELPSELKDEVAVAVRLVMENIIPESGVAFPVHIKIGPALGSMHDL